MDQNQNKNEHKSNNQPSNRPSSPPSSNQPEKLFSSDKVMFETPDKIIPDIDRLIDYNP